VARGTDHVLKTGMGTLFHGCACLIVMAVLSACADEDAQNPPPATPDAPPTVVQNNTYNNNITYRFDHDTTVVADAASPAPPTLATAAPIDTTSTATNDAGFPSVKLPRATTLSGAPRDLRSTGIVACDEYLDRVESCSRALLPSNVEADRGFQRIQMSLDMTRRAWRNAAANTAAKPELARTCSDARALYESSVEDKCP
jgi:hypothetical protein